jgi:hypothetical protein
MSISKAERKAIEPRLLAAARNAMYRFQLEKFQGRSLISLLTLVP